MMNGFSRKREFLMIVAITVITYLAGCAICTAIFFSMR